MKTINTPFSYKAKFDIELIGDIKVKSLFSNDWLNSEYWGSCEPTNNEPFLDFGIFGEVAFEISELGLRLFFPSSVRFAYSKENPVKLYAQPYQKYNLEFVELSPFYLDNELIINEPLNTMHDLTKHLKSFINKSINDLEKLNKDHAKWISGFSV